MKNILHKQKNGGKTEQPDLGTMLAKVFDACVIRGGKDITITDDKQLLAEYKKGMPVMPRRIFMLDENGPDKPSPAEAVFERLARDGRLRLFMKAFFLWPSKDGLGNAHEVAEALMTDLILAGQSDGWHWVMADVKRAKGTDSHSWLEYKGWALDAACGQVLIWKAWYYRAIRQPRKFSIRDAAQIRADWRKQGHGLDEALEKALASRRLLRVYDFATKKITEIAASELPPGMMPAQVAGVEGPVWVDQTQIKPGTHYYHPPFTCEIRREIEHIATALKDVYPLSLQQWEDGFRRDQCAEKELFQFNCIAEAYVRMTTGTKLTQAQKKEYFRAMVITSASDRDSFTASFRAVAISMSEALAAAEMYQRVFHEMDGPAKVKQWTEALKQGEAQQQNNAQPKAAI